MQLPDLNSLGLRCVCGEAIDVVTWDDYSTRRRIVSMRCHGLRLDTALSDYDLHSAYDAQAIVSHALHRGEREIANKCPSRQPIPLGEVISYHEFTYNDHEGRPRKAFVQGASPAMPGVSVVHHVHETIRKPTVPPGFGEAPKRKLVA